MNTSLSYPSMHSTPSTSSTTNTKTSSIPSLDPDSSLSYPILSVHTAAPSDKGASSPCSPTSTTHHATPEWASPDLSFRSYLNQISIDTNTIQEEDVRGAENPQQQQQQQQHWSKRSLSVSSLGVHMLVKQMSNKNSASSAGYNNKRQRKSVSINIRRLAREKSNSFDSMPTSASLVESYDTDYDENTNSGLRYSYQKSSQHVPKSIYISFPAISDDEPSTNITSQQNRPLPVSV